MTDYAEAPAAAVPLDEETDAGHPRKWIILAVVGLGMFMAVLDTTIVNIAVPAILADLETTISHVSWVLNAYNLGLAVFFLSFGRLADRFGHRLIFALGVIFFSLFSLACGLAPGIGWLIAFRVGQSISAAAMIPVSLIILMSAFPRRQHGIATALWGVIISLAAAVGPSLGGFLVEYASWQWIFFVNVPVGALALIGTAIVVPEYRARLSQATMDVVGIVISGLGFFALTLGLIQGNSWGWSSGRVLALIISALVLLTIFVLWEWRSSSPMLDLRLFRIRSFSAANAAMFFVGATFGGALFLIVIFLVNVLGYPELQAAVIITPMPVTALVLAPISGKLLDRIGPRPLAVFGGICFATSLLLLSQLGGTTTLSQVIWRLLILGAGFAFCMPTLTAAAMGSLPLQSRGIGSGAINTSRQLGLVLGVAISVAVFASTVTGAVNVATKEATSYVNAQSQIPAPVRQQIVTSIEKTAAANKGTAKGPSGASSVLGELPPAPAGSTEQKQQKELGTHLSALFRDHVADAFHWPFRASAICAFLSIPFSLLTGRRLGEHRGQESGAKHG